MNKRIVEEAVDSHNRLVAADKLRNSEVAESRKVGVVGTADVEGHNHRCSLGLDIPTSCFEQSTIAR